MNDSTSLVLFGHGVSSLQDETFFFCRLALNIIRTKMIIIITDTFIDIVPVNEKVIDTIQLPPVCISLIAERATCIFTF